MQSHSFDHQFVNPNWPEVSLYEIKLFTKKSIGQKYQKNREDFKLSKLKKAILMIIQTILMIIQMI